MKPALHIVEPTLTGFAGHAHSLVRSLAAAAPECDVTVWAARGADPAGWQGAGRLVPYFHRRLRRLQAPWLYRRLLRGPGRILVATAGSADLAAAAWAAGRGTPVAPHRMHFFVHWLGRKAGKADWLASVARRQPAFEVLAPTAEVTRFFAGCGFRATQVPYPIDGPDDAAATAPAAPATVPAPFRHLLAAGAARMDKGFGHVVALVAEMRRRRLTVPVVVQASHEGRHGHPPDVAAAVATLRGIGYPALTVREDTLSPAAYRALFDGAVAVQPYRAEDFRDRVSGVTLDALRADCPVVVTAGTWMADVVQRFGAGVATADLSPEGLLAAVETVLADHARYAGQARAAGRELDAQHSARRLMDVVLERA